MKPSSSSFTPQDQALLEALAPGSINFSNMRGSLKNTLVLSHYASSSFGFDVADGKVFLGIPTALYQRLMDTRVHQVCSIEGKAGLFFLIESHFDSDTYARQLWAFKLQIRKKRLDLIRERGAVCVCAADRLADGNLEVNTDLPIFQLRHETKPRIDWE